MDFSTASAIVVIFTLVGIGWIINLIIKPIGSKTIPGPWFSFPILGHLPLLGAEPWITLTQWKKFYGPIFAIKMGMYDVIVLNESKLIKEAFSRPELSGRQQFELFQSATQGKGIIFSDGPLVVEQRKFALKSLQGFGLRTNLLEESIHLEIKEVLDSIDKKCGRALAVKGMFAISVLNGIWSIFMGQRFEHDDPKLHQIADGIRNLTTDDGLLAALSPFIPAISKFTPEFSGFNKKLQGFLDIYALAKKAFNEPLPRTRTFGYPQNYKEAFIDEMERVKDNPASSFHPDRNFFQYSAGDILMAAMETVSTTIDWLLLYMAKHPKVQKKVQAEIDEKIGTTRVPALTDKDNTPYVEATIQELFRCSSVLPLSGVFKRATEDTVLLGYVVKKDTLIAGNAYGVHYDKDVWGDPEKFRPERFIDDSGKVDRNLMRAIMPFSTGKRSCIGETLSRDQIYLYSTRILQRFNVSCDEAVSFGNTVGLIRAPQEFNLTFTKRFRESHSPCPIVIDLSPSCLEN